VTGFQSGGLGVGSFKSPRRPIISMTWADIAFAVLQFDPKSAFIRLRSGKPSKPARVWNRILD
jgi:hypothetical protein